jgi:hypothetical protein
MGFELNQELADRFIAALLARAVASPLAEDDAHGKLVNALTMAARGDRGVHDFMHACLEEPRA